MISISRNYGECDIYFYLKRNRNVPRILWMNDDPFDFNFLLSIFIFRNVILASEDFKLPDKINTVCGSQNVILVQN